MLQDTLMQLSDLQLDDVMQFLCEQTLTQQDSWRIIEKREGLLYFYNSDKKMEASFILNPYEMNPEDGSLVFNFELDVNEITTLH